MLHVPCAYEYRFGFHHSHSPVLLLKPATRHSALFLQLAAHSASVTPGPLLPSVFHVARLHQAPSSVGL